MLKTSDGGPEAKTEFKAILTDNIVKLLRERQDEAALFFSFFFFPILSFFLFVFCFCFLFLVSRRKYLEVDSAWGKFCELQNQCK